MKWIFRLALTLVTLVIVAVAALFLIPSERIARLATDQFQAATGRALTITGEVRPTLFPRIGVRVSGVSLANAAWSDQGPMLQAAALDVGVNLSALMGGAVRIERLQITEPVIVLERAGDGKVNWAFTDGTVGGAPTAAETTAQRTPLVVTLDLGTISNGTITYIDHSTSQRHQLSAVDLEARLPSMTGTATVAGSALYNGAAVRLDASLEGIAPLLAGQLVPVQLALSSGGTSADINGRMSAQPLAFEGKLLAESRERAQILAALGQVAPVLPQGLGRCLIGVDAALTVASGGSVHLRDMVLTLDGNTLRGDVDLLPAQTPLKVVARLEAGVLDLRGLSEKGRVEAGTATATPAAGWSTNRIDVSALSALDAEITLRTGTVSLGDATLDALAGKVTLDRGRAVLSLGQLQGYGGTIAGEVVVNGRGGLSARADLSLAGLQMLPFLNEFVDYYRLVGEANGSLNVLAVGNSMDALMKSLSGKGQFSIGQGEIIGLDLAGMLRNFDTSFRGEGAKTIFDGVTASFTITDGILRNDDLNLIAPLAVASGSGVVNIGAQTLDYRVVPEVLRGEGANGVRVPVLITGTWANPKFRPDLEFLFDEKLEAEKAALEDRAREEADAARTRAQEAARRKLAEELEVDGTTLTDGGSVEDAVKKRLEDELKGVLGGLLGRE
jgi:AsmA protein